ncbi:acyl-CoA N-acyltransferase [Yarrowia lipolytica]|uniref:YALI0A15400p n=1 Tax=Yarrowia lipolytica (strain CLIB 122 / E 150) TaxID=284591 RepID=Q6CGW9_YARLI|nr:YALI0A15400p [Yarrowia lipolytica CLIB122]RDW37432.1 acyl-CoA N-acyltransferase [Yarrowia lipolytica]CAG84024.1 YALI0A15400p [Yarrowia lipolytica CLIB122]|eukprot:XP_500093.1 YALI0A15400p [Yarrowia lipolytica CLIB122]
MRDTIETDRLILSRHTVADFEDSVALWNDEETVKFCGGARPRATVWTKLLYHRGHWDHYGYGCYVVRLKEMGEYLGEIGTNHFMRDSDPAYSPLMPEAGWVVNPKYHGKGIATEALTAIFKEADASEKITHPICCIIDHGENEPSRAIARKFGFKQQPGTVKLGDEEVDLWIREKRN